MKKVKKIRCAYHLHPGSSIPVSYIITASGIKMSHKQSGETPFVRHMMLCWLLMKAHTLVQFYIIIFCKANCLVDCL